MGTIRLGKRTEGRVAEDQGFRPARRPQRHRLWRLGHLRRGLLRGGADGGRARDRAARSGADRARSHQAHAGRVRPALRQAAARAERQEGQEQAGPRRAADRRHPRVQVEARLRPAGDGVDRQHRGLHEGRAGARVTWPPSKRASSRATTRFRRAWSTRTRRCARACRLRTRRRTSRPTCPRCWNWPRGPSRRSPATT